MTITRVNGSIILSLNGHTETLTPCILACTQPDGTTVDENWVRIQYDDDPYPDYITSERDPMRAAYYAARRSLRYSYNYSEQAQAYFFYLSLC